MLLQLSFAYPSPKGKSARRTPLGFRVCDSMQLDIKKLQTDPLPGITETMSLKKSSVLVIDDDTDVLTAVKLLLKTEVGQVITEKNPEQILSLLGKQSFDIILLDMNFSASVNTGN